MSWVPTIGHAAAEGAKRRRSSVGVGSGEVAPPFRGFGGITPEKILKFLYQTLYILVHVWCILLQRSGHRLAGIVAQPNGRRPTDNLEIWGD